MDGLWPVLLFVLSAAQTVRSPTCSRHLRRPKPGYHLTKECAESRMRTVAASNATDIGSCEELAAAKNAFAFAYADANRSEGPKL
ncbi:Hypothetical protein CINCED_3A009392 [Cinara cedri]|uniref:Secreted protein n=1 Tax=Cinara cedri TaxID=506608 RepID=A0A5E4MBP8_9HEMI|nr:Hypothetical protein CINCED_3A009392 [Cinara cedri]